MIQFYKDKYNFWKQKNPHPINYDIQYKKSQQTTSEMSYLRLGYLLGSLNIKNIDTIKFWNICDVGSGNGTFVRQLSKFCNNVFEYDLSGNTITEQKLYNTNWDVIFLTDVLQHYLNIDDLFKINFKYAFISFPQTPKVNDWKQLITWKHFKPNQHIYMLDLENFKQFLSINNCNIISSSNIEDVIRQNQQNKINITTVIFERCK